MSRESKKRAIFLTGGPPWGFRVTGGIDKNISLRVARVSQIMVFKEFVS